MDTRDWFSDILLAFLAILPVVNPFSKPPIFLSITEGWTIAERRDEAFKASLYAFIILFVSLVAGTFVLKFFSISLPALQVAGGLLIARTAFQMLNPQKEHHQTPAEESDAITQCSGPHSDGYAEAPTDQEQEWNGINK